MQERAMKQWNTLGSLVAMTMITFAGCEMHTVEDSDATQETTAYVAPSEANATAPEHRTESSNTAGSPVSVATVESEVSRILEAELGVAGALDSAAPTPPTAPAPPKAHRFKKRGAPSHSYGAKSARGLIHSGQGSGGGGISVGHGRTHSKSIQLHGYGRASTHGNTAVHGNTEAYDAVESNAWRRVMDAPLSTFSIDVDTASYANVRRMLREGRLPVHGAVRIEEMLNYFNYPDAPPTDKAPFAVRTEVGAAPWDPTHHLMRVAVKGREIPRGQRPPSNLVFLLDVSGSMSSPDKLPLLKEAFKLLVGQLDARDTVTIAVYAGSSGLVLAPTRGDQKSEIINAINRLRSGGGTHGAAGIKLAYTMAAKHFIKGGINRVILATDGDMNVGTSSKSELVDLVKRHAKSGVFLSVLGFGRGNLKDAMMEAIADKGNGNYAYIDSVREARKVLSDEFGGTLITIAKDVKLQVEFNPAHVAGYRLIGYENRMLAARDFNDDKKDAGELGAGHTVTALYEIVPAGQRVPNAVVDPLKYQTPPAQASAADSDDLLTIKLRYKKPSGATSKLMSRTVQLPKADTSTSASFRWASAVAAFGMLLRDSPHRGNATWDSVIDLATSAVGTDRSGQRMEMVVLAKEARRLAMTSAQLEP
jgi:Ca-activated chloride channel homolog